MFHICRECIPFQIATFPVELYSYQALIDVFSAIWAHQWPSVPIELHVGVYNVGASIRKGFLDVTERDIQTVVDANIHGVFVFSHQLITTFKSIFSAGKSMLRALSQSLNKEFGKENIHVSRCAVG